MDVLSFSVWVKEKFAKVSQILIVNFFLIYVRNDFFSILFYRFGCNKEPKFEFQYDVQGKSSELKILMCSGNSELHYSKWISIEVAIVSNWICFSLSLSSLSVSSCTDCVSSSSVFISPHCCDSHYLFGRIPN